MSRSTLTSKGQVTLPRDIREYLGVETGDRLSFEIRDGVIVVEPETVDLRSLGGVLAKPRKSVSFEEMDLAVRRGASRD